METPTSTIQDTTVQPKRTPRLSRRKLFQLGLSAAGAATLAVTLPSAFAGATDPIPAPLPPICWRTSYRARITPEEPFTPRESRRLLELVEGINSDAGSPAGYSIGLADGSLYLFYPDGGRGDPALFPDVYATIVGAPMLKRESFPFDLEVSEVRTPVYE